MPRWLRQKAASVTLTQTRRLTLSYRILFTKLKGIRWKEIGLHQTSPVGSMRTEEAHSLVCSCLVVGKNESRVNVDCVSIIIIRSLYFIGYITFSLYFLSLSFSLYFICRITILLRLVGRYLAHAYFTRHVAYVCARKVTGFSRSHMHSNGISSHSVYGERCSYIT